MIIHINIYYNKLKIKLNIARTEKWEGEGEKREDELIATSWCIGVFYKEGELGIYRGGREQVQPAIVEDKSSRYSHVINKRHVLTANVEFNITVEMAAWPLCN